MGNELIIKETRVNVPETLKGLPENTWVSLRVRDFAPLATVRAAVSRLNKKHVSVDGDGKAWNYVCESVDNGESVRVRRSSTKEQCYDNN